MVGLVESVVMKSVAVTVAVESLVRVAVYSAMKVVVVGDDVAMRLHEKLKAGAAAKKRAAAVVKRKQMS